MHTLQTCLPDPRKTPRTKEEVGSTLVLSLRVLLKREMSQVLPLIG